MNDIRRPLPFAMRCEPKAGSSLPARPLESKCRILGGPPLRRHSRLPQPVMLCLYSSTALYGCIDNELERCFYRVGLVACRAYCT